MYSMSLVYHSFSVHINFACITYIGKLLVFIGCVFSASCNEKPNLNEANFEKCDEQEFVTKGSEVEDLKLVLCNQ